MATEEVGKPLSLPPYPQMIMEAIDALGQQRGSSKISISKFIESKYGPLPAGHANLLTAHLDRLKVIGDLVFYKYNYQRPGPNATPGPGPNATPRRGRGRPPKQKSTMPVPPGTRRRGRPRKDANGPPVGPDQPSGNTPTVSKTGRPRGRPRKVTPQAAVETS